MSITVKSNLKQFHEMNENNLITLQHKFRCVLLKKKNVKNLTISNLFNDKNYNVIRFNCIVIFGQ